MSPATITPLPGGQALFVWRGIEHTFDDVFAALAEADRRGIPVERVEVEAFAPTPVVVVATSPALTSS
ncbi:hypothetical protein AMIS_21530 [Actinoplanes missouriensis 431]|uniref:Uncharacterized protein n=1 Tax=Actinoplanes missouriensis (strain ATCC 14538 / DSM 43046 / CBS 188.64 / JCM 3121 / NBRC 102363 / NCIMB 12654 / NRRL B-3342 / UNCC 431) TaxID=512565 RepID=I0H2Y6_ACTM4|nr:hypothetical protein [Actinoplanes missouriensis]BAL87373.1 hypothetical protein AMIS_21530 [Actinoplanes missouriensis 431]